MDMKQVITDNYAIYNGDCIQVLSSWKNESIDYVIYSPPFADLYKYSDSPMDMGNCDNYDDFMTHYSYLVEILYNALKPGRLVSIHCMNIPAMKERDGYIGIKDFRGDQIRTFQKYGFIYHAEVCIWKDPLIEATRTKALGLLHKQIQKDSAMCRHGLPDYIVTMRKPGENKNPIEHDLLAVYAGKDDINQITKEMREKQRLVLKQGEKLPPYEVSKSHAIWRAYASPVWMDINQTGTLNYRDARAEKDEKHICPLQLDTIERCITLWSNEGDVVLSPFAGIGSEGYVSLQMGRRFIGVELKPSYYALANKNLESAKREEQQCSLLE